MIDLIWNLCSQKFLDRLIQTKVFLQQRRLKTLSKNDSHFSSSFKYCLKSDKKGTMLMAVSYLLVATNKCLVFNNEYHLCLTRR